MIYLFRVKINIKCFISYNNLKEVCQEPFHMNYKQAVHTLCGILENSEK